MVCHAQIPLRFDPIDNNLIRTGYYYLPSKWQSKALPVMVLFHGLEGYGLDTIQAGSGSNFQVFVGINPTSLPTALSPNSCCSVVKLYMVSMTMRRPLQPLMHARPRRLHWRMLQGRRAAELYCLSCHHHEGRC